MDDPTAPISNHIKLAMDYRDERGIPPAYLDDNHIRIMISDELSGLKSGLLKNVSCGYFIPYYDSNSTSVDYWGVRILERRRSFHQSPPKYIVPSGPARIYLPLTNPVPNNSICIITESAIKALVLSMYGVYAVGLNGCWGFRSRHTTDRLNPDLQELPWRGFSKIMYLPDSNWENNDSVKGSIANFASLMMELYDVDVKHLPLPHDPEGNHWGIDDYHALHGHEKTAEFLSSEPVDVDYSPFMVAMLKLNKEVCYTRENNIFINVDDNTEMNKAHFEARYSTLTYLVDNDKKREATKGWMQWDSRNEAQRIVNHPGESVYVEGNVNLWRPSEVVGVEGPVKEHIDFLKRAIPEDKTRLYVQQWIAHLIQHPDKKHSTALVFYSPEEGTGKTMLGRAVARILGRKNALPNLSQEAFSGRFNSSYTDKELIVINETFSDGKGHDAIRFMDKLKTYITESTVMREAKHSHAYEIDNYCNVIMTTNHVRALQLSPSDRRFTIVEFGSQFRFSKAAENRGIRMWNWHDENLPALRHYYESFDLYGFEPSSPALETEAKQEMREATMSWSDTLASRLKNERESVLLELSLKKELLYLKAETLQSRAIGVFIPEFMDKNKSLQAIGNSLKKYGINFKRVRFNGPIKKVYGLEGHKVAVYDMDRLRSDVDVYDNKKLKRAVPKDG